MERSIDFFNILLPFLYLITFGIYFYDFIKDVKSIYNAKRIFLFLTLLVHVLYLIERTVYFNHFPITNVFEIFTVLAFCIAFSYFILELLTDIRGTGLFILIFSLLFQLPSTFLITDLVVREELRSSLLGSHVFSALLGYSGITISAVYGFLYLMLYKEIKTNKFGLIFNRLPNLEILEYLSFYSAIIGFIALTVTIVIGTIWLPMAFANFSYWDPKLIGTILVWIIYFVGIMSKLLKKMRGKRVIYFSIIGFIIAISSTLLTNFLAKSFHSFL